MGDRPSAGSGTKAQTLGRYHLGEPLGGGPTGEVFRAKLYGVAGYERQYAVKRFHAALVAQPASAEALAAAARAYANVVHPHIARLAEYGVSAGQSYVAVELVNGVDSARLIAGTTGLGDPVPRGALLMMLTQLARGVGYAHARGVVHGGICPTNVVFSSDGDPKVTDFGFMRARLRGFPAEDPTLVARLPYLAPEQLDGLDASPETDVFQLGAYAIELLTGERAFPGKSASEIAAAVRAGLRNAPEIPPAVWEVLSRALGPVGARYVNAGALADALDPAVRRVALPGGRGDVAAAVKRVLVRTSDLMANASGAVSFPLPAPPASVPGVSLASLFPGGEVPRFPARATLAGLAVPPMPKMGIAPSPPVAQPPAPTPAPTPAPVPTLQTPPVALAPPSAAIPKGMNPPSQRRRPPRPSFAETPPPPEPEISIERPRRSLGLPFFILGVAVIAAGAYLVYDQVIATPPAPRAAKGIDAAPGTAAAAAVHIPASGPDAAPAAVTVAIPDAAPVAVAVPDAAPVAVAVPAPVPVAAPPPPPDAAPPPPPPPAVPDAAPAAAATPAAPTAPAPEGRLLVTSSPAGAAVYLDGAPKGRAPVEIPASNDHHKLAVLLAGYKLARRDIQGSGRYDIELEKAPKLKGPAGIKLKCRTRDRYYIIVDGQHTGMFCPNEQRINVELGDHVVEVYDALSDDSTVHQVPVRETHNSIRITIEE